jgi:hypothetical protein
MSTTDVVAQDLSKYPDWSGQRRRAETGPPRYDSTKPSGRGQQAPLTEEYRAVHEASMADQAAGGQGADTTARCLPLGMPRAMTTIFPLEFIITPTITYVLFENSNGLPRRIYTDGRDFQDDEPTFVAIPSASGATPTATALRHARAGDQEPARPATYDNSGIPFHKDNLTVIKEKFISTRRSRTTWSTRSPPSTRR